MDKITENSDMDPKQRTLLTTAVAILKVGLAIFYNKGWLRTALSFFDET